MTTKTVGIIRDLPVFASEGRQIEFDDDYPQDFDASFEELEDLKICANDNILIAGKIEQDFAMLEIYVYEKDRRNLYVHHDLFLTSFPVALEWLGCNFAVVEQTGVTRANIGIVGTMQPEIELWDLDVQETVEPKVILAGNNGHTQSVTGLQLHHTRQNILASSSADKTLKIWDLQTQQALFSYTKYKEAVQGLLWHPTEESVVLSYSGDNFLTMFDARDTDSVKKVKLPFGIESFCFFNNNPNKVAIGSEDGSVCIFDIKTFTLESSKPLKLHAEAITGLLSTSKNTLISSSLDSYIKITDQNTLELIAEEKTKGQKLFGSSIHPDNPFMFACGSSVGEVVIWDTEEEVNKKVSK